MPLVNNKVVMVDTLQSNAVSNITNIILPDWHIGLEFYVEGSPITTGEKCFLKVPFAGNVASWSIDADVSGNVACRVLHGSNVASLADITGTEQPALVTEQSNGASTLTGWDKSFVAGDYYQLTIDSVDTVEKVLLTLDCIRS